MIVLKKILYFLGPAQPYLADEGRVRAYLEQTTEGFGSV